MFGNFVLHFTILGYRPGTIGQSVSTCTGSEVKMFPLVWTREAMQQFIVLEVDLSLAIPWDLTFMLFVVDYDGIALQMPDDYCLRVIYVCTSVAKALFWRSHFS